MKTLLSLILILLLSVLTASSGGNSNSEPELTVINAPLADNISDKAITPNIVQEQNPGIETYDIVIAADDPHVTLEQLKIWWSKNTSAGEDSLVLQATGTQLISMLPKVSILSQVIIRPADFQLLHRPRKQLLKSSGFQLSTNYALWNGDIANEY